MLFNNTNMRTAMAYTNAVGDKVYPIIVDIKKGIKSTEEVSFVSSDINTGVLSVAFIQGNDTYNVEGAEVICSIMRPDTTTLEIPCNTVNGNTIEVPLGVNGTSQDGVYSFDFKVFKGGNKIVGTPIMNYSVSLSISNDNVVLEDDRLPVLTMLMTQVSELHDRTDEAVVKANTATEASKEATANAIEATNNANAVSERVSQETATAISEIRQDTANAIASMNQSTSTAISTMNQSTTDAIANVNATSDTMVENVNNAISSMDTTVNSKISEMTDVVNNKISEVNTAKNEMINDVSSTKANMVNEVTNAKNEMTTTVSNKVNEVENRFNALTSKQQQDAEVIDARDGETSLKARLDRDIEKAKQVYVNVEGNHISTDSSSGYLKDVEILGNTIQDASNLADIRSVGDTVEGQELYEIPVLSCGKNLFDGAIGLNNYRVSTSNGATYPQSGYSITRYIKIKPNTTYYISTGEESYYSFYDINYKYITGGGVKNYKTQSPTNAYYLRFDFATANKDKVQLEEGTVATPYEPYVEDKLTILSPVQLEKVGDVADRIICKDGVWGVEKSISTVTFDGSESWNRNPSDTNTTSNFVLLLEISNIPKAISNIFIYQQQWCNGKEHFYLDVGGKSIVVEILKSRLETDTTNGFKKWLSENNLVVKYIAKSPQFIPLPHDQQIKLRTFANKTNISFLTEIEGTIKAQVPKSLGATVNTHTEQISNLNKELDRVKKLEESTVSTVETESDFTTVEATSNGYFEDVKLEGKTLVNKFNNQTFNSLPSGGVGYIALDKMSKGDTFFPGLLPDGVQYGIFYNHNADFEKNYSSDTAPYIVTKDIQNVRVYYKNTSSSVINSFTSKSMLLEGDHTQNPPSYFEGLKSVGQSASEDGADEIVVSSVKGDGNLFDFTQYTSNGNVKVDYVDDNKIILQGISGWYAGVSADFKVKPNTRYLLKTSGKSLANNSLVACAVNDVKTNTVIHVDFDATDVTKEITTISDSIRITLKCNNETNTGRVEYNNIMLVEQGNSIEYTPHQSDKKQILYYNNETQSWEKPILRQWDSIEKHADGKYYYHQRSGEVVLNGSEEWDSNANKIQPTTYRQAVTFNSINMPNSTYDRNISSNLISDLLPSVSFDNIYNHNGIGIGIYGNNNNTIGTYIVISNGFKNATEVKQWLQANNVTVVYQLAQEKVYECTNIDLITYANETNYIVECGAIVPKTTLKVHNNISNVVRILQEKVSLLEDKFIQGLKQVLAGDMYSLAELLYPEDFEEVETENNIMLLPLE